MSKQSSTDSLETTDLLEIPDPEDDPSGYLKAKGWKVRGDPKRPSSMWQDPLFGPKEKWTRVDIGLKRKDNDLLSKTYGQDIPIVQSYVTPAVPPMKREYALIVQMQRDADEAAKLDAELHPSLVENWPTVKLADL